jgi:hypothetical protein
VAGKEERTQLYGTLGVFLLRLIRIQAGRAKGVQVIVIARSAEGKESEQESREGFYVGCEYIFKDVGWEWVSKQARRIRSQAKYCSELIRR